MGNGEGEAELLRELNGSLHEMSQPMTVLLCTLEYGASLSSMEEMKQTVAISQEACERLRKMMLSMQMQVREAIETESTRRLADGVAHGRGQPKSVKGVNADSLRE